MRGLNGENGTQYADLKCGRQSETCDFLLLADLWILNRNNLLLVLPASSMLHVSYYLWQSKVRDDQKDPPASCYLAALLAFDHIYLLSSLFPFLELAKQQASRVSIMSADKMIIVVSSQHGVGDFDGRRGLPQRSGHPQHRIVSKCPHRDDGKPTVLSSMSFPSQVLRRSRKLLTSKDFRLWEGQT
jgi:hypothetical protein